MMKKILTWINGVVPKRNVIIFNSNPDLADNAYQTLVSKIFE